ncbi:MAG TPA: hypothetical protein VFH41_06035 [Bradyrhizobium sp.]|nr:hypothetical protein [Bradyrhizobium sp.]
MTESQGSPMESTSAPGSPMGTRQTGKRDLTVHDVLVSLKLPDAAKFLFTTCVIMGGVYTLGASHPFSNPPTPAPPTESKTFHGYYGRLKGSDTSTIDVETLSFELLPNSEAKATSKGIVETKNGPISRVWSYLGFQKGSRLSMSYSTVSTKEDPIASGIGLIMLEQQGSSDYTGTSIYLDCDSAQMMKCPYALTTQNITVTEAKDRWPKLFQHTCAPIDLVPDQARSAIAATSCQKITDSN